MSGEVAADRMAVWENGDVVYFAPLPRGPISVLQGVAVTIWSAAKAGRLEDTADRVALAMGLEVDEIRETVDDFVDRLVAQGLLSRAD